jgi:hypothetical protein
MDNSHAFPLSLDFEGKHYRGKIVPSTEKDKNGLPVYFRVLIDNKFFAYLCCDALGWSEKDSDKEPTDLVKAIGTYITEFYK